MNAHDQQLEDWRKQTAEFGALWARVLAENSANMKRLESTIADLAKSQQELVISQKEFASSLIRLEEKRLDDNKRANKLERQLEIHQERFEAYKVYEAQEALVYRDHLSDLKSKMELLIEVKKDNKTIYIGVITALLIAFLTWAVTTLKNTELSHKTTLLPLLAQEFYDI